MRRIYVFDSGVGGLSLVRFLNQMDAAVSIVYVADAANFPYGDKNSEQLREILKWHMDRARLIGADAVAIACNTMSSVVAPEDGEEIPIFHIFEGWGEHLSVYSSPIVITTLRTHASGYYQRLITGGEVVPMPDFVDAVQVGDDRRIKENIRRLKSIAREKGADAIVLGCTHFSFIYELFKAEFAIPIEDPVVALASRLFHMVGSGKFEIEVLGKTDPRYDMVGALERLPGGEEVLRWRVGSSLTIPGVWSL